MRTERSLVESLGYKLPVLQHTVDDFMLPYITIVPRSFDPSMVVDQLDVFAGILSEGLARAMDDHLLLPPEVRPEGSVDYEVLVQAVIGDRRYLGELSKSLRRESSIIDGSGIAIETMGYVRTHESGIEVMIALTKFGAENLRRIPATTEMETADSFMQSIVDILKAPEETNGFDAIRT